MSIKGEMAKALRKQARGDVPGAIKHFRAVLARNPRHFQALYFSGLACQQIEQHERSKDYLMAALLTMPPVKDAWHEQARADAFYNLGRAFVSTQQPLDAINHYVAALEHNPDHLEALINVGHLYREFGAHGEGMVCYDHALWQDKARPEARYMRAFVKLSNGDYEGGWADHEARWQCPLYLTEHRRDFMTVLPRWDGATMPDRTLLIHWEQGFGDTIQFARYIAPAIERFGGTVMIEVQQALTRLMQRTFPNTRVFCVGDDLPAFDRHISVASLPSILGGFGDEVPYLVTEHSPQRRERLRVGICWAGNTQQLNDYNRSTAFDMLKPILDVPNVDWLSLQVGPRAHESGDMPRIDPRDFADTADAIAGIDLVITVDTSMAHIAGAIGKRVWIMIPPSHDWRYPRYGNTTPWYPTARLYRQQKRQEWAQVIQEIAHDLAIFANPILICP